MNRQVLLVAASAIALAACDGFKEAMSAHQDVVARAGSQELSVTRFSELLSNSKVPLNRDVARQVAKLWVDYQLLGHAAARGDSLADKKVIDEAMWSMIAQAKATKWHEQISKGWSAPDAAANEARYSQGEFLAARHILIVVPQQGISQAMKDSLRKRALAIRAQVTPANFAKIAEAQSMDPGSKSRGGALGVFPRGAMVPAFEQALVALKPGEISPVVTTDFGYHIIYRQPYAEVKDEFAKQAESRGSVVAESTYLAKVEASGNIKFAANAAATIKAVAADVDGHQDDNTVIATSLAGDFTSRKLARWLAAFPPQAQVSQKLQQQPDSVKTGFAKKLINNELVLRQADSAKVTLDSADLAQLYGGFSNLVSHSWTDLGVDPKALADSGKTPVERERIASARIENYMDRLLSDRVGFVDVPQPLESVLHSKFEYKLIDSGIDRALERAAKLRAVTDSTKASNRPPSAVPMPQMMPPERPIPGQSMPMPQPGQGQPREAAPAPKPSTAKPPATKPATKPATP